MSKGRPLADSRARNDTGVSPSPAASAKAPKKAPEGGMASGGLDPLAAAAGSTAPEATDHPSNATMTPTTTGVHKNRLTVAAGVLPSGEQTTRNFNRRGHTTRAMAQPVVLVALVEGVLVGRDHLAGRVLGGHRHINLSGCVRRRFHGDLAH